MEKKDPATIWLQGLKVIGLLSILLLAYAGHGTTETYIVR
jgi:hypothetical protein